MDTMNLDQVTPLRLEFSGYVKIAMGLLLDNDISKKQLLKHLQNACIVYACLGVKRNAGILSTEAKYAEAAKGYKEISVPGFFRWARDNDVPLLLWLTQEKMGHTTINGAPILFNEDKKLWSRFDKAMHEMKQDYNPIWDRCCCGCSLKDGVFAIAVLGILNGVWAFGLASLAFNSDGKVVSGANFGNLGIILIFSGIFELLRSAVGIYASSYEDVASAKIYMYSWFIIGGSSLLSFVSRAASNLSWDVIFYQLLFWGLWIYFTMVARSYYLQLENKSQGSASGGDVATGFTYREVEMA